MYSLVESILRTVCRMLIIAAVVDPAYLVLISKVQLRGRVEQCWVDVVANDILLKKPRQNWGN